MTIHVTRHLWHQTEAVLRTDPCGKTFFFFFKVSEIWILRPCSSPDCIFVRGWREVENILSASLFCFQGFYSVKMSQEVFRFNFLQLFCHKAPSRSSLLSVKDVYLRAEDTCKWCILLLLFSCRRTLYWNRCLWRMKSGLYMPHCREWSLVFTEMCVCVCVCAFLAEKGLFEVHTPYTFFIWLIDGRHAE